MQVYLVGGAIRDTLLGLPVKERDWVVVGATIEEMLALGFMPVGKDFPVFLHPETHEEYALARTERKIAKGYKGFQFHTDIDVTLKDDLARRDLTINAIAQDQDGNIIDPFDGQKDLQQHWLRHVSPAFAEDPVRILRIARFAAKLEQFSVFPETNELMQTIVENGEVDALVPERVWKECARALKEKNPMRFFLVLDECNALATLFPDIKINSKGMQALQKVTELSNDSRIRFATLFCDIAPEKTKRLCQNYRIPKEYSELAMLTSKWHKQYHNITQASAEDILTLLKNTDGLRRPQRFHAFLQAARACSFDDNPNRDQLLLKALDTIKNIDIAPLQQRNLKGKKFADALQTLQTEAINNISLR